jgi:hypothetical protein
MPASIFSVFDYRVVRARVMSPPPLAALGVLALTASLSACSPGLIGEGAGPPAAPDDPPSQPGDPSGPGPVTDADAGTEPTVEPPAPRVPPTAPQLLRLLSGAEYRATVQDLLGVEASPGIDHASIAGGFDTGAEGQVQEALFVALAAEAERLAEAALGGPLRARFPCLAAASLEDACVRDVLAQLGGQAFRRPLPAAQLDTLLGFFGQAAGTSGNRADGLKAVLTRMLLAPEFLYRPEVGRVGADGARRLDAFEQASLVSYALTGSMPDAPLFAAAATAEAAGQALDEATLRAEARRLLATPRGQARIAALIKQWVRATPVDDMVRRPEDFPKLGDPAVGVALHDGLDAFVLEVVNRGDGTLTALLDSPFAMVNRHTAPLVGQAVEGDQLVRVELPRSERRGLLTQPGVLAALGASGEADKDRPVLRGYMLKTQLLCEQVGPPSGLNTAVAADTANRIPGFDQMTTRQQYEAMMEQGEACSACHATFMPLGFAFGRYDALGRYRPTQRGQAVDPSARGVPVLGEVRDFEDGLALTDVLSTHGKVAACFVKNVVAFVTGLGSAPSVEALAADLGAGAAGPVRILGALEDAVVGAALVVRLPEEGSEPPVSPEVDAGTPGSPDAGTAASPDASAPAAPDAGRVPAEELLLESGEELSPNESRSPYGGRFNFVYQGDGNLVLYEGRRALWNSRTARRPAFLTAMQGDGNLVVYSSRTQPVFNTGTHRNPGAALYILQSGVLQVRASNGRVLWDSSVRN